MFRKNVFALLSLAAYAAAEVSKSMPKHKASQMAAVPAKPTLRGSRWVTPAKKPDNVATEQKHASKKSTKMKKAKSHMEMTGTSAKEADVDKSKSTAGQLKQPKETETKPDKMHASVQQKSSLSWLAEQAREGAKDLSTGMARKFDLPLMTMHGLLKLEATDRGRLLKSMGTSRLVLQRVDDSVKPYSAADLPKLVETVAHLTPMEPDELKSIMEGEKITCDQCSKEQIVQKIADTQALRAVLSIERSRNSEKRAMNIKQHSAPVNVQKHDVHAFSDTCHSHCYEAEQPFGKKCKWRHCGGCVECGGSAELPAHASEESEKGSKIQITEHAPVLASQESENGNKIKSIGHGSESEDSAIKLHTGVCAASCYNARHSVVPWEERKCTWKHCGGCQECHKAQTLAATPSRSSDDTTKTHKASHKSKKVAQEPKPGVGKTHKSSQKANKAVHKSKLSGVAKTHKSNHTSKEDNMTHGLNASENATQVVTGDDTFSLHLKTPEFEKKMPKSRLGNITKANAERKPPVLDVKERWSEYMDKQTQSNQSRQPKAMWCENGIIAGSKCCAASCGTCGGDGCGSLPGGASQCCHSHITSSCTSTAHVGCEVPSNPEDAAAKAEEEARLKAEEEERLKAEEKLTTKKNEDIMKKNASPKEAAPTHEATPKTELAPKKESKNEDFGCADGSTEQVFMEGRMVGCDGAYTKNNFRSACAVGWHVATASDYFASGGTTVVPNAIRWVDVTWDGSGDEVSLESWQGYFDPSNRDGRFTGPPSQTSDCTWVSTSEQCELSFAHKNYGTAYGCHCRGGHPGSTARGVVCAKTPESAHENITKADVESTLVSKDVANQVLGKLSSAEQDTNAVVKKKDKYKNNDDKASIKNGRLPAVATIVSNTSQVLQTLNAQLGDLKSHLAAAEAKNHLAVASQRAEYRTRLKIQHENTTKILKENEQIGAEIAILKDKNVKWRATAKSLQAEIDILNQTMVTLKANISIAQEFIVNSLNKDTDDENKLTVLSELAARDAAASEKKERDTALAAIRASHKKVSLVQIGGPENVDQATLSYILGLQKKFEDLDREQNSSAVSLYEEFNSQFTAENKVQMAALEEQQRLLQSKQTETELHERLIGAVELLKPLVVELKVKVESLRSFAERVSQ